MGNTRIKRAAGYGGRLLIAVTLGIALSGFLPPATVHAETVPVDLQLDGEGATSWHINDIKPTDNGTELVKLHNAGSKDGFLSIWVSDVVYKEGTVESHDKTIQKGGLPSQLLLGLDADGLTSYVKMPTPLTRLPQDVSGPGYIEIIPIKSGQTVDLEWSWLLPALTGNDVQADSLSFTINYMLQEFNIIDVSEVVSSNGTFTENVTAQTEEKTAEIVIPKDTVGTTQEGEPVKEIWLIQDDKKPPVTENTTVVGQSYEIGPDGTTFDRPLTISLNYEAEDLPDRVSQNDLTIGWWDADNGTWVKLNSSVNAENKTITAQINHFSRYGITAPVPPPLPPASGILPDLGNPEPPSFPAAPTTVTPKPAPPRTLEVDLLGQAGKIAIGADGTLEQPLKMSDPSGNFVLEINKGSRLTGSDNKGLGRLELSISNQTLIVQDNTVILSPVYKLIGFTQNNEITPVKFEPSAKVTLNYNPKDLPANAFPPYIANYTDDERLIKLEPPADALSEAGKAVAVITHASLFVVLAEIAPPPPPLPAKFTVNNLTIDPAWVQLGQPITISLTISNQGEVAGTHEIYLVIDGIVRAIKDVNLNGQSSQTISFKISNLAAGRHQVSVAGLTGDFRVIAFPSILPAGVGLDWKVVDLSILAIVTAGILLLYLFVRRSQQRTKTE